MSGSPPGEVVKHPYYAGALIALAAAVLFGLTTPLVAAWGAGLGPLSTAALLYAGAAGFALVARAAARGAAGALAAGRPLVRGDVGTLVLMAIAGAVAAPVLFVVGLTATGPTSASMALNAEALFTVVFATVIMREPWHRDLALGVLAMLAGGLVLAWDAARGDAADLVGLLCVLGATAAWAADNTLSRRVSEARPGSVVAVKGALGASLSLVLALALGEPAPRAEHVALLAVGATGYGASLALYLLAQRRLGAARTGSIFAVGPFLGALVSFVAGDRASGLGVLLAAPLFALGVWLHARERHAHAHVHAALEHEHAHRHDDGHHAHAHDPPVMGTHSHPHRHERLVHEHAHAPDVHHRHPHGGGRA